MPSENDERDEDNSSQEQDNSSLPKGRQTH